MEDHSFSLPLLATPAAASSSSAIKTSRKDDEKDISGFIPRLFLVIFIGIISVWADYEASKGFKVTIVNDANNSPAGRRFDLFYVSNDEATRVILNTSAFVENILYPHPTNQTKKPVRHVVLQLSSKNLTNKVTVETSKPNDDHFVSVISLSPSIMEETNVKHAVISAIQRAMARVWLWDGESRAPPWLIEGLAEYIWMQAETGTSTVEYEKETTSSVPGSKLYEPEQFCYLLFQMCSSKSNNNFSSGLKSNMENLCYKDKEPKAVAKGLGYLHQKNEGYIRGINQILSDRWDDNQPCH